jgi:AcrR family transcriptional regulator
MFERGVASTTLADVRTASATSKSQLYQHFADKDALVREVIEFRAEALLAQQRRRLEKVDSLRGLELWRDEMVERNALRNGAYGCPLGSMANEIADQDEDARQTIATHFDEWLQMLIDAIDRLRERGVLRADADSRALASGLLAALQGGYLLAKTARDVNLMRVAVDMAIAQIRAFSVE